MTTRSPSWLGTIERKLAVLRGAAHCKMDALAKKRNLAATSVRKGIVLYTCICILSVGTFRRASADDDTLTRGKAEFEKALNAMRPRPSLDSTPVEFSIAGIQFRMPRNYLITMDNWNGGPQGLVTVRLSFPDLQPITDTNRKCVTGPPLWGHSACEYVEFTINQPGSLTAEQAFENSRDIYRNQTPITAPFGFEKYEIGPENARLEDYRKVENGRTLFYTCIIQYVSGERNGLCSTTRDQLPSGAGLFFFFNMNHLHDIAEIDAKLRNLVESFTIAPPR
jgi:hypothetical protein